MTRVGLYPGTFDPVHDGHIAFALAALDACGLDKVVFLPEPKPRSKHNVTSVDKRTAMLQLAAAPYAALHVHALPDEQFTVATTLPQLQQLFGSDLTLLVGSDVAQRLDAWPGAPTLRAAMRIAVGQRSGDTMPTLPGAIMVPTPHGAVAASQIRSGQSKAIAPEVLQYIRENHLYVV